MSPQAAPRDARQQRNSALRRAAGALLGAIVVLVLALALDQEPGGGVGTQTRAPQPQEVRAPPSAQITAAAGEEETVPGVPPLAPAAPTPLADVLPMTEGAAARPPVVGEAPASVPSARERPPPSLAALMAEAASAPVDGYRIQLGVFSDPENAIGLARELNARGLAAGIQSRVVLGPFADRDAAHKAQAALRAAGVEAGMLLPPARKKR